MRSGQARTAMVFRDNVPAAVVCGGSLVRKGSAGRCALDVVMQENVLQGGAEAFDGETDAEVGVVPWNHSVPGREYEALGVARHFQLGKLRVTPRAIL